MPPTVWIDQPPGREIDKPHFHLYGWYISSVASADIQLTLNGKQIPVSTYRRPDVETAYPRLFAKGFSAFVWLSDFVEDGNITLTAHVGGQLVLSKDFVVRQQALEESVLQARSKSAKRSWLSQRLKCTVCGVKLVVDGD